MTPKIIDKKFSFFIMNYLLFYKSYSDLAIPIMIEYNDIINQQYSNKCWNNKKEEFP